MTDVGSVRAFNRVVTERVGALHDEYLARGRPLGASRVLWEVGNGTEDVRELRSRLGLDSGYLSRLLRLLDSEGLIEVRPSDRDARVRTVQLTRSGQQEHSVLDQASDDLASSFLEPLNPTQRERLVEAMETVRRLLTAGLVDVAIEDPASADAQFCISEYFGELDRRFDTGFDPTISMSADVEELTEPAGLLLIARLRAEPIGCGALKLRDNGPADVKRMWISPSARGLGLGRRLLLELEAHAAARGATSARLETNSALEEAISLYRSTGYIEVDPFNDEPFAHHWFEKPLPTDETLDADDRSASALEARLDHVGDQGPDRGGASL